MYPLERTNRIFNTISYLQRNDKNGFYHEAVEDYHNNETSIDALEEMCVLTLEGWLEGTDAEGQKEIHAQLKYLKGSR
jgi:hypothetical protein